MNLLSTDLFVSYAILLLTIIFLVLWHSNKTKRHRQWLLYSLGLGLGIGPTLVLATGNLDSLGSFTFFKDRGQIVELSLLSGLFWATASTWLLTIRKIPVVSKEVSINWLKVIAFYLLLIVSIWLASLFNVNSILASIAALGLISILLSAQNYPMLIRASISALLFIAASLLSSYIATYLEPKVVNDELFGLISLTFSSIVAICVGFMALSSPIVSHWWFSQPLHSQKLTK